MGSNGAKSMVSKLNERLEKVKAKKEAAETAWQNLFFSSAEVDPKKAAKIQADVNKFKAQETAISAKLGDAEAKLAAIEAKKAAKQATSAGSGKLAKLDPSTPTQTKHIELYDADDVQNALGVSASEAKSMVTAIDHYSGSYYTGIRRAQAEGKYTKDGDNLEKFIAVSPKWNGGETRRGVRLTDPDTFKRATTVGGTFEVNAGGSASWSTNTGTPDGFAGNIKGQSVVFINKSKYQTKGTSIRSLSNYFSEDEVLVSKDAHYRVVSVSEGKGANNNRTYVVVEEIE